MLRTFGVVTYGDLNYRDRCSLESEEQIAFVNYIRTTYPDTYGKVIVHIKNEGKRIGGQHRAMKKDTAMGMTTGAADIIIPGSTSFVCELKRRDHTKSVISDASMQYLVAAHKAGAFSCVALGYPGAVEAFDEYLFKHVAL